MSIKWDMHDGIPTMRVCDDDAYERTGVRNGTRWHVRVSWGRPGATGERPIVVVTTDRFWRDENVRELGSVEKPPTLHAGGLDELFARAAALLEAPQA